MYTNRYSGIWANRFRVLGRRGRSQKFLQSAISMLLFRTVFFWFYVKNEWKIGSSWYPSIRIKKLRHTEAEKKLNFCLQVCRLGLKKAICPISNKDGIDIGCYRSISLNFLGLGWFWKPGKKNWNRGILLLFKLMK